MYKNIYNVHRETNKTFAFFALKSYADRVYNV